MKLKYRPFFAHHNIFFFAAKIVNNHQPASPPQQKFSKSTTFTISLYRCYHYAPKIPPRLHSFTFMLHSCSRSWLVGAGAILCARPFKWLPATNAPALQMKHPHRDTGERQRAPPSAPSAPSSPSGSLTLATCRHTPATMRCFRSAHATRICSRKAANLFITRHLRSCAGIGNR